MFEKVLIPLDFSPAANQAFKTGMALACHFHSHLILLTVIDDRFPYPDLFSLQEPSENYYRSLRQQASEQMNQLMVGCPKSITVDRLVLHGHPAQKILEVAQDEKVNLIVMSTHGTSGLEHYLLGSVTEKVIRHAPCPVLVLRKQKES